MIEPVSSIGKLQLDNPKKRQPNRKVLREDLEKQKSGYEKIGWKFSFNENKWRAEKTFPETIVPVVLNDYEKISLLFWQIDNVERDDMTVHEKEPEFTEEEFITAEKSDESETIIEAEVFEPNETANYTLGWEFMQKFAEESYSADILTDSKNPKIRKPFMFNGDNYVSVGGSAKRGINNYELRAYKVVPAEEFEGERLTYLQCNRDNEGGFYHGLLAKHGKNSFVLVGPKVEFVLDFPFEEADQNGWQFERNPEGYWSATKTFEGSDEPAEIKSVDNPKTLVKICLEYDAEMAEKLRAENNLPSQEQADKIAEYENRGWKIEQTGNKSWRAETEIDGKKVFCGDHFYIDAMLEQMSAFDPLEAAAEEIKEDPLPRSVVMSCKFDLTENEIIIKTNSYFKGLDEITEADAELKLHKDDHKRKVEQINKRLGKLRDSIDQGIEYRELECILEYNFELSLVNTIRPDTGEIVSQRPMTSKEVQKKLF